MGFEVGGGYSIAVDVWNTMGGQIDWTALETLVEYYGVQDVERLIDELVAIRNHKQAQAEVNSG